MYAVAVLSRSAGVAARTSSGAQSRSRPPPKARSCAFPGAARWRKSSHSDGNGGDCVEVAVGAPGVVPVRDGKVPDGAVLVVAGPAWAEFVGAVGNSRL